MRLVISNLAGHLHQAVARKTTIRNSPVQTKSSTKWIMGNVVLTQKAPKERLNICKYQSPVYVHKLCSNEPHFYIMYLATDVWDTVQNFLSWMVLQ